MFMIKGYDGALHLLINIDCRWLLTDACKIDNDSNDTVKGHTVVLLVRNFIRSIIKGLPLLN